MKFSLIPLKKPNEDCSNAVVFREQNVPRRIDLCAAPTNRPLYNTSHNAVTLYFEARPAPPFDYLLEYAGTSVHVCKTAQGNVRSAAST